MIICGLHFGPELCTSKPRATQGSARGASLRIFVKTYHAASQQTIPIAEQTNIALPGPALIGQRQCQLARLAVAAGPQRELLFGNRPGGGGKKSRLEAAAIVPARFLWEFRAPIWLDFAILWPRKTNRVTRGSSRQRPYVGRQLGAKS